MDDFELGVKKLTAEMIHQALADLANRKKPQAKMGHSLANRELRYSDARKWIDENSLNVFGFRWCLGLCGVNPNFIRRAIKKIESGKDLRTALN
jgi:hypothetical protein